MFLIPVLDRIALEMQKKLPDFMDLSYNDRMTYNIFNNFTDAWGKEQAQKAMKHLAEGKMVGLKSGFDAIVAGHSRATNTRCKIYWLHSYTVCDSVRNVSGYGVRVFFCADADKRYSSEKDNSHYWGERMQGDF